jgi:photosystem II stability/assembly factor-like uncharacterized protein
MPTGGRLVAVGERGHIVYADNWDRRWIQAQVPVSVTLTAVAFATAEMGWAVGHDAVVLHTRDGGRTWQKQLDGTKINQLMLAQLHQLINTKSRALKLAQQNSDNARQQALSMELEDLDLFLNDVQMAVQEGPTRPLMDVWFKNAREGIVIGAYGMILATTDAGANWQPLLDRINNPQGLHYYGITLCGNTLFIAGERGLLFRSDDWGKHWQPLTSPYKGSFFGIIGSADGRFVIAFGLGGAAFYSHNQGVHWAVSNINSQASISGGAVLADGSVCLAGVDGTLMSSTDSGRSFSRLSVQFPGAVALTQTDIHDLMVVGLKGIMAVKVEG